LYLPNLAQSNGSEVFIILEAILPLNSLREFQEITAKLTYFIEGQKHDVLMVDNTRLLNSRKAFSDNQRDIDIRLCDTNF
jgi:alpha-ketoglutarate-dependent taurine dioxygenase